MGLGTSFPRYGCNVDTLVKHYVAMDEQQVTDDVFAKMNEKKVS